MPDQKQKGPQELALQADHKEITLTNSIAYQTKNIPDRSMIGLDSFVGTVWDFRSYLKAQRHFLAAGVIAP